MTRTKATAIDAYIAGFPEPARTALEQVRKIVRDAVPTATETIKYDMPTFVLNGNNLVHFAGYKQHVGFYPAPMADDPAFTDMLAGYKTGRGSIQFPLASPIPENLVRRIVEWRIGRLENKA